MKYANAIHFYLMLALISPVSVNYLISIFIVEKSRKEKEELKREGEVMKKVTEEQLKIEKERLSMSVCS